MRSSVRCVLHQILLGGIKSGIVRWAQNIARVGDMWTEYESRYNNRVRGGQPGVQFPAGARFSLFHSVQTGSGATQRPVQWAPRAVSPGDKAEGAWSWPLTSIKCRSQRWSYTSTPLYVFMACVIKHRDNLFIFLSLTWRKERNVGI
jgi:hypothetical protein